jgi:putative nucleotidyltransferase with HDIG domain
MNPYIPTHTQAFDLLKEFNASESLISHALAVEAAMRYLARKYHEDEDQWGAIGLIHDLDYQKHPDQHCIKTKEILEQRGWPEEYIRAAISHGLNYQLFSLP